MSRKKILIAGILGILACWGCDDSSGRTDAETECTDGSECPSGHCNQGECAAQANKGESCDDVSIYCTGSLKCADKICVAYVGEGESCDDLNRCADALECTGGVCSSNGSSEGQEGEGKEPEEGILGCQNSDECEGEKICEDANCVDIVHLKHGDACSEKQSEICEDQTRCWYGECRTEEEIENYGKCRGAEDCVNDPVHPDCLENGKCGSIKEVGDLCDNDLNPCREGVCELFCIKYAQKDEPCDPNGGIFCTDSTCLDGYCRAFDYNLPIKSECNDQYMFCGTGLSCVNNICTELGNENDACDESEAKSCKNGLICRNNICTPLGNSCTKTADCQEKDSFCCLDESCGATGFCIPYDDKITHDDMCRFKTKPGIFEAQIQCRWQPDTTTGSKSVEMPPLVGPFGNKDGLKTVIGVYSYSPTMIRFIDPNTCKTLESISETLETRWYNYPAAADFDGDGLMEFVTGTSTRIKGSSDKIYLYKWNEEKQKHELKSTANVKYGTMGLMYDIDNDGNTEIVGTFGSVVRVDKKTLKMTVLTDEKLFDDKHTTSGGYTDWAGNDAAIGNIDGDANGIAELVTGEGLYTWDKENNKWIRLLTFPWHTTNADSWVRQFAAYADFGTYDAVNDTFDTQKLDGKPEIVISGKNYMTVYAVHKGNDGNWTKKDLMKVGGFKRGGPITIGDFNNDGLPEIGIASNGVFGVYDIKCTAYQEGRCADKYVMWERWSQDESSGTTGSSLFDFDGDGQPEAVYADECFTRVYDGKTGRVLFSAKRSSTTSIEGPVIADIDNDGSAEILMGSDANHNCYDDTSTTQINPNSPGSSNCVDPIHEGIRCEEDADCPLSKNCDTKLGLCLCETDNDCNTQLAPGKNTILQQYVCADPIDPNVGFYIDKSSAGTKRSMVAARGTRPGGLTSDAWNKKNAKDKYKVCRATRRTTDIGVADLMIFKDRLDRWVSSRNIWNQHAYNIINVEDNGAVPNAKQWLTSWNLKSDKLIDGTNQRRPLYNNYRLNSQGAYGAGMAPDITGRFIAGSVCGQTEDGRRVISGNLCNRGTKPVADKLPATFFYYDENAADHKGQKICTSYTNKPIGIGECDQVGCTIETEEEFKALAGKKVLMISNLDENGFASTVECNGENNSDTITIESCSKEEIVIVN